MNFSNSLFNNNTKYVSNSTFLYSIPKPFSTSVHPGLASIYNYHITSHEIVLVQEYCRHNALSFSRFHAKTSMTSPSLTRAAGYSTKDIRLRFILYQLLQCVAYIHAHGLCLDSLTPKSVMLDDEMWISIALNLTSRMCLASQYFTSISKDHSNKTTNKTSGENCKEEKTSISPHLLKDIYGTTTVPVSVDQYEPITVRWVKGKISNFEYLMTINYAAGRSLEDPLYHPVLPWVTDFSTEFTPSNYDPSTLRDLTKTKFRLSKGDAQLHTTYRHSQPPHHIPETLSELTYYIYIARRAPMQSLQRIVRNDFVPEHYPHSMARMYDWTPDECIPAFYMDPEIFNTVHGDKLLNDITCPVFASTPEEFIRYHRLVLESDEVSAKLHTWIDLTFGSSLLGEDAVNNLNVPLKHSLNIREKFGDSPNLDKHPGFVVLFDKPHPSKVIKNKHNTITSNSFDRNGDSLYSNDLKDFIDIDSRSKFSIMATKFASEALNTASHNDNVQSSYGGFQSESKKYLSKGVVDPTAPLLLLASPLRKLTSGPIQGHSGWETIEAIKFADRYGASLEPLYQLPHSSQNFTNSTCVGTAASYIDTDFVTSVLDDDSLSDNSVSLNNDMEPSTIINALQAQDMFSVGCIIAELYTSSTFCGKKDVIDGNVSIQDIQGYFRKQMVDGSPVPINIKRLITLLMHPKEHCRPSANDILRLCQAQNYEQMLDYTLPEENYDAVLFFKSNTSRKFHENSNKHTNNILELYCQNIFPSYFRELYHFIGCLKVAENSVARITIVLDNLKTIMNLPLDAIGLALPHLLPLFSDPRPFREHELSNKRECDTDDDDDVLDTSLEENNHAPLTLDYPAMVDALASRLGVEGTETILMPHVIELLTRLNSLSLLRTILLSTLWQVIINRAGPKCFLRQFLPTLITYIMSGTMQKVSKRSYSSSGQSPLWAFGGVHPEKQDFIHNSSYEGLRTVQNVAVVSIMNLALPEALGPGLCMRYVVPALLCLVGIPQFAVTGYNSYMEVLNGDISPASKSRGMHVYITIQYIIF
jgi:hypothetical protein